jgi:hypothetical protein
VNHSIFIANANPDFHHGLLGDLDGRFEHFFTKLHIA